MQQFFGRSARALALFAALAALAACARGADPEPSDADGDAAPLAADAAVEVDALSLGSYLAGRYAYSQGDIAASADYLTGALAEDPDNLGLLRMAVRVVLADGRFEEAFPLAHRLVVRDPLDEIAQLALAVEEIDTGAFAPALARLATIPHDGVNSLLLPLLRAWAAYGQGNADAALQRLQPLQVSPSFAPLRDYHAGLIHDLAGLGPGAERLYTRAIEAASGGTLRIVLALGRLYEREGRFEEAERIYAAFLNDGSEGLWLEEELARLARGEAPARLVGTVQAGVAEALFSVTSALPVDDPGSAGLIHLQLALYLEPDFPMANILLGELFEARAQYERALKAYRTVEPATPAGWLARLREAAVLNQIGRVDEAVAVLARMGEERSHRSDALVLLGDVLRANERFADAVAVYDRVLARRAASAAEEDWTLFYARGVALERSKAWDRAEADFKKALELEPEQPYVLNYLGYSWVERGEHLDEAQAMIERAVALRPDDGFIVDSLGWVLYRRQDFAAAVGQLERAVELQPDDPVINHHLGDAYWRVGRLNEARFQWSRALSLDPSEEDAAALRRKLAQGLDAADEAP